MNDPQSFRYKGKQGYDPRPFDSRRQRPLMLCAGSGNTPGQYLPPLGNKTAQRIRVFVIDLEFLNAKFAYFFLGEKNLRAFPPAHPVIAVTSVCLGIHPPVTAKRTLSIHIFFI
jgi:hypothetical protein